MMRLPYNLFVFTFLFSAGIEVLTIVLCKRFKWYDQVNERKVHTGNIPRLGGVGFVIAFSVSAVYYFLTIDHELLLQYMPLLCAGFLIFVFGVIDDFCVLPAKTKLVIQIIAVIILLFGDYRFTYLGPVKFNTILSYGVTFCYLIGMINSFNLIDGIDGLCGGITTIIAAFLSYVFMRQDISMSVACLLLVAALLGFLLFNKPKAKIFMGDGGSQFLGFIIAALPLCKTDTSFESNKLLMCGILASIPLIDTVAAIWRRTREHRPLFSPDKSHLHHKLMYMGFSVKGILVLLYSLQIIICCAVVIASKMDNRMAFFTLASSLCFVTIFFSIIHYSNRALHLAEKAQAETDLQN